MKKYLRKIFLATFLVFLPGLILIGQDNPKEQILQVLFEREGERYFRFQCPDRELINGISRVISIDNIGNDGYVYAYANARGFSSFLDYCLEYEMLPHPGNYEGELRMLENINIREIQEWDFYPTYDGYVDMMQQFAADYPSLCQVFSIGTTIQGRQLLIAKISDNVGMSENEPQFLYTSSIHGDETTGYVLMLRLIDYLLSNYGTDPRITSLVSGIEIWINPLANPDGTYWGGNNTVGNARRGNANNIDMNRNYPDPAAGPHPDGNEWQPETVAFMQMAEENHFVSGANLHGGTEVCNYPWDTWSRLSADDDWWQYVCHQYADTAQLYSPAGYMNEYDDGITNGYAWYTITGGRQDYMNYFHQCREFTLEISDTKLLPPSQLPDLWEYNYRSLLNYLQQSAYGLRGTVKDSITNWPIEAEVYAIFHEKDSSWVYSRLPSGNYHRLLPEGTYSIRFSAPGYATKTVNNVTVNNEEATVLNIVLAPEGGGVGGIENNNISQHIFVYPNPVTAGNLRYESSLEISWIKVLDVMGKEVRHYNVGRKSGNLRLEEFSNGLYFLEFGTATGIGAKRIMLVN